MVTDKDGVIWIATAGSGLIKLVPNGTLRPEITFITVSKGLLQDRLTSIHLDHQNRIWYGTDNNGVGVVENGRPIPHRYYRFRTKCGSFPRRRQQRLFVDRDG